MMRLFPLVLCALALAPLAPFGHSATPRPNAVDVSAVARFFDVADELARDATPSAEEWRALLDTPGYRLIGGEATMRAVLPIAFMPSQRARRDSVLAAQGDEAFLVRWFAAAMDARADLTRLADSLAHADLAGPVARAAAFLPPGTTLGRPTPLVTFAVFGNDGYASDGGVVIDILHARRLGADLAPRVAHELHHEYLMGLQAVRPPAAGTTDAAIARAFFLLRNEGLADLVDKRYPVVASSETFGRYAEMYNGYYVAARDTLRVVDSLVIALSGDWLAGAAPALAHRLLASLPFGGHPVGAYMARTILESFGRDSLMPAVASQYALARIYAAAERARGRESPLSPRTLATLAALERKYRR